MDIYSRSYGSIEGDKAEERITLPPDYNGNLYREPPPNRPSKMPPADDQAEKNTPPREDPSEAEKNAYVFRSVLEKISAEDLIMFVLILSILFGDSEENGAVLAVILAILLT